MPLYEYQCDACDHRFERIRKFSDPPVDVCPHCGKGPVRKLLSSPAIQFKGTGWYVTDYAKKGRESKEAKPGKESKDAGAGKSGESSSASAESSASAAKPAESSTAAEKKA